MNIFTLKLSVFIVFLLLSFSLLAQQTSSEQSRIITVSDSLLLDSLTLIPNSIELRTLDGLIVPDTFYRIDYQQSLLIFWYSPKAWQQLHVSYRRFPYNFSTPYRYHQLSENLKIPIQEKVQVPENKTVAGLYALKKSGSLSRGVTAGNQHDLVVHSDFRLSLKGQLNEDIAIEAKLTDNNLPIQADGRSQHLHDFNEVFIRLQHRKGDLQMGDLWIESEQGQFFRVHKKARGLSLHTRSDSTQAKSIEVCSQTAIGSSQGKYHRAEITSIEGMQGPYLLPAPKGELLVIVLSGTETVYIDGIPLQRGENQDYTIDYNRAELSFTAKQPVNSNSRIVVEYEYADRNYIRYLSFHHSEWKKERIRFDLNYYSETDSKTQSTDQPLSYQQIRQLSLAENPNERIYFLAADSVAYQQEMVLYALIDTLVGGISYENVYCFSQHPDSAHYQLRFSLMGKNKGNYRLLSSSTNERIFEWIAPIDGVWQGRYEPIQQLYAPENKQLASIATQLLIGKSGRCSAEAAWSMYDANRFVTSSQIKKQAAALFFDYKQELLHQDSSRNQLQTTWSYQYLNRDFDTPKNFRDREFVRDWNLQHTEQTTSDEHFLCFDMQYSHLDMLQIDYSAQWLNKTEIYQALRNQISLRGETEHWRQNLTTSFLQSKGNFDSNFIRWQSNTTYLSIVGEFGIGSEYEDNQSPLIDTSFLSAPRFHEASFWLKTPKNKQVYAFLLFKNRLNWKNTKRVNEAYDLQSELNWTGYKHLQIRQTANYRIAKNDSIGNIPSLNVASNWHLKLWQNALIGNISYQLANERERKNEFFYIKVPQGQGQYHWMDYNENGLQELNEFEVAHFSDEATFMRYYRPTQEFVPVYRSVLQHSIFLSPLLYSEWRNKKSFWLQFSDQINLTSDRKSLKRNYFPLQKDDSLVVASNLLLSNRLTYKSKNSKYMLSFWIQKQNNKLQLSYGWEQQSNDFQQFIFSYKASEQWIFLEKIKKGNQIAENAFFIDKNYQLEYLENELIASFGRTQKNKQALSYRYLQTSNQLSTENMQLHVLKISTEKQWKAASGMEIDFSLLRIYFNGNTQTPVAYQMMEGYKKGFNMSGNIRLTRLLNDFLQINLVYTLRKHETMNWIQQANVEIRALF